MSEGPIILSAGKKHVIFYGYKLYDDMNIFIQSGDVFRPEPMYLGSFHYKESAKMLLARTLYSIDREWEVTKPVFKDDRVSVWALSDPKIVIASHKGGELVFVGKYAKCNGKFSFFRPKKRKASYTGLNKRQFRELCGSEASCAMLEDLLNN